MYAFGQLLLAMGLGTYVSQFFINIGLVFPGYIGAMLVAAVIRNISDMTGLSDATRGKVKSLAASA